MCKHYHCILFPALKANIDAVFTTNDLLTVNAVYLRILVLFRTAQVISPCLARNF